VIQSLGVVTGAVERELHWASLLLNELVGSAALQENDETRATRRSAIERFEQFALPAAVFHKEGETANEAWRTMFGEGVPAWAVRSLDVVRRTKLSLHLATVPFEGRSGCFAATITITRAGEQDALLVVCAEMTDAVIARELAVPDEALVWSGPVTSAPLADYANLRARTACTGMDLSYWQERLAPGHDVLWKRAFADALRDGTSQEIEVDLRDTDGALTHYRARITATSSNARWFMAAVPAPMTVTDADRKQLIEQIREVERAAERARQVKDLVLAAVSHELRAPLTTTMLWLRVLRDPTAEPAARAQAIEAIDQSSSAQARIVGDLLDVSRAMSGKLHVDVRPVDIGRLVGAAVEASLPAALAKRITLVHEGDTFTGELQADGARLRQVLDNVLSNAIKFTPPAGMVKTRIRRKRLAIVIDVEDTGCGIEESALPHIFEPFRQARGFAAPAEGGLGLGLAIAKQIVELHHGTITATSGGIGQGTLVTLTLPAAGHRRAPSPPAGVAGPRALNNINVLVIDDDARVRVALTELLRRAGAHVVPAESAPTARNHILSDAPHVIVCDIAMPGEDGYEFMRALRASGNKIPAIALTGYASRADADMALSSGFDMHVAKPIDFDRLVASVTHLLRR
jgi:signal transduction histidine kinase